MNKTKQKVDKNFWVSVGLLVFILTFTIYLQIEPERDQTAKPPALPMVIGDWHGVDLVIDKAAIDLIKPDSFIFRKYFHKGHMINVFIGYYESLEKSDLAHSPLVCYPGQGWIISGKKRVNFELDRGSVEFASMKIDKGAEEHLVIYGYRAAKLISGSGFKARLHLIKEKLLSNKSNSAFMRFSTEIKGGDLNRAKDMLIAFIKENIILLYGSYGI